MAECGNHGIIIPRDKRLLTRLYWDEGWTLPQLADMFGVEHSSVGRAMDELGIPRRGCGIVRVKHCIDCGVSSVRSIQHPLTKNGYGRRCHECQRKHKVSLQRVYVRTREDVRARRKEWMKRWYETGPINPTGDLQWIRKAKHLLRSAKRLLQNGQNLEASEYLKTVSRLVQTSHD